MLNALKITKHTHPHAYHHSKSISTNQNRSSIDTRRPVSGLSHIKTPPLYISVFSEKRDNNTQKKLNQIVKSYYNPILSCIPTNSERNVNGNGIFRLPENRAHLGLTRRRRRSAAQIRLQARVFGDGGFETWREL